MPHIDFGVSKKFKHSYGCCPGHDWLGGPISRKFGSKHGSKSRQKGMRIAARMTRRIKKQQLEREKHNDLD